MKAVSPNSDSSFPPSHLASPASNGKKTLTILANNEARTCRNCLLQVRQSKGETRVGTQQELNPDCLTVTEAPNFDGIRNLKDTLSSTFHQSLQCRAMRIMKIKKQKKIRMRET